MTKAFGIISSSGKDGWVEGLENHRSAAAFSFLGRYRAVDFPISNMSNSGINHIQIYVRRKPHALSEHISSGRHYNINSKRGSVQLLFAKNHAERDIYNTDISAYMENLETILRANAEYVVIAADNKIFVADFRELLDRHIESGADITLLYHSVDNAKEYFLNCNTLNLNRQKGVLSLDRNQGNTQKKNIFMDTYIMKKTLFLDLLYKAKKLSSIYSLPDVINHLCGVLDVRGISHRGYFASLTDFKSYYNANLALIDYKTAASLFNTEWPIYTRTNDSCPTQYFETSAVTQSVVSNGCLIEGTIENSVIGRGCVIKKGAVVRNCVLLPEVVIGENVHAENLVVDKLARLIRVKEIIAPEEEPAYINRGDTI